MLLTSLIHHLIQCGYLECRVARCYRPYTSRLLEKCGQVWLLKLSPKCIAVLGYGSLFNGGLCDKLGHWRSGYSIDGCPCSCFTDGCPGVFSVALSLSCYNCIFVGMIYLQAGGAMSSISHSVAYAVQGSEVHLGFVGLQSHCSPGRYLHWMVWRHPCLCGGIRESVSGSLIYGNNIIHGLPTCMPSGLR